MLYAKVVFGLAVKGAFDYLVPKEWEKDIKAGARVWVSFGRRRALGYCVGLSRKTKIKNLKSKTQNKRQTKDVNFNF